MQRAVEPRWNAFDPGHLDTNLRRTSVRGGAITLAAQWVGFLIQMVSTMILARLLSPEDHGLVAMVTLITGFIAMFRDAGLSMATIQSGRITHDQVSTLFWVNAGIGAVLTILLAAGAPLIAVFYGEPRLVWVTVVMAAGMLFSGLTVQHSALLQRQLRFGAKTLIELSAQLAALSVAIVMALQGFGYWSLVGLTLAGTVATTVATWLAVRWIPGRPRRGCGVGSMLRFGGNMTGLNVLNYLARNADNVLIGWAWGSTMLGLYAKAYGILLMPITQIQRPIASVAIPTLARLQDQPERFRKYFLAGYRAVSSVVLPLVVVCTLFADQLVLILLGPNWHESTILFLLLAPAALAGALMSPMGWVLDSLGRADRHLRISFVVCPAIVVSFIVGLAFGARGVAISYSVLMVLLLMPVIHFMIKGTGLTTLDVVEALKLPVLAVLPAAIVGWGFNTCCGKSMHPLLAAGAGSVLTFGIYGLVLVGWMRQGQFYLDIWRQLRPAPTVAN